MTSIFKLGDEKLLVVLRQNSHLAWFWQGHCAELGLMITPTRVFPFYGEAWLESRIAMEKLGAVPCEPTS